MLANIAVGLRWWLSGKESACNAGNLGSIPGSGRSSGEGNSNPLQASCLGNPLDLGAGDSHMMNYDSYMMCICIYICMYMNHLAVHLKLTQHSKSTLFY